MTLAVRPLAEHFVVHGALRRIVGRLCAGAQEAPYGLGCLNGSSLQEEVRRVYVYYDSLPSDRRDFLGRRRRHETVSFGAKIENGNRHERELSPGVGVEDGQYPRTDRPGRDFAQ